MDNKENGCKETNNTKDDMEVTNNVVRVVVAARDEKSIAGTTAATPVPTGRELSLGGGYIQATPQQTAQNPPAPVHQDNGFSNPSQPSTHVVDQLYN